MKVGEKWKVWLKRGWKEYTVNYEVKDVKVHTDIVNIYSKIIEIEWDEDEFVKGFKNWLSMELTWSNKHKWSRMLLSYNIENLIK